MDRKWSGNTLKTSTKFTQKHRFCWRIKVENRTLSTKKQDEGKTCSSAVSKCGLWHFVLLSRFKIATIYWRRTNRELHQMFLPAFWAPGKTNYVTQEPYDDWSIQNFSVILQNCRVYPHPFNQPPPLSLISHPPHNLNPPLSSNTNIFQTLVNKCLFLYARNLHKKPNIEF